MASVKRRSLVIAALIALVLTANLLFQFLPRLPVGEVQIHFLDVGQADATLIVSRAGSLLIDAGDYDAGAVVYEACRRYGKIDYLLLSHGHSDHAGGAPYLLRRRAVKTLMLPAGADEAEEFADVLNEAERRGVPVVYLTARDVFAIGGESFTVLAPLTAGTDGNEDCLVLRMDYGATSAIFPADATEKSEAEQLATYGAEGRASLLDADLLKAGHHGSDSSTSAAYLDAVTPVAAFVSCGACNAYGHPGSALLARLEERGVRCYRTDRDGTVVVATDGAAFRTVRP